MLVTIDLNGNASSLHLYAASLSLKIPQLVLNLEDVCGYPKNNDISLMYNWKKRRQQKARWLSCFDSEELEKIMGDYTRNVKRK